MYIPKKYGSYKADNCPFCGKTAITKNSQSIPVCVSHKESILRELTCNCGDPLELRDGKFGSYFNCMNCGNFNLKKALGMNPKFDEKEENSENKKNEISEKKERKEITITSDECDVHYT
ncbi:hypothetical protein ISS07_04340 [Candidatus Woesearchaeota archaeon]|nr:hypothetical protein [Candidatus Woesearchaeota archaeon]